MRTMTIPSATMRRLKQAAAAARAGSQAAAPAPVLRRPAGDGGGAARGPARVHRRPASPASGRRHATAGASVRSNGCAPVRANNPAAPAQAASYSSPGGKRRATAPPPASGRPAVRAPRPAPPIAPAVAIGDRLLVRTPVTNTLAGQHVVMTIGAVVVSVSAAADEEDGDGGYLEVILDGDFPPQDPSSPVCITRDQIVVTSPAAVTKPPAASGAAASTTVPREAGGSAEKSLRGAEEQRNLKNAGLKRNRY